MTTHPHRFTIASTHRYLEILAAVCANDPPTRITIDPTSFGLSAATIQARLRDSATAFLKGYVTDRTIDPTTLRKQWPLYYVTTDGASVLVVPKAEQDTPTALSSVGSQPTQIGTVSGWTQRTEGQNNDVLRSFALLLGLRFITGTLSVPKACLPDALREELTNNHDIAIVVDGENYIIL